MKKRSLQTKGRSEIPESLNKENEDAYTNYRQK